jgi:hypothetical protein
VTRLRKMMLEELQRRNYSQHTTRSYIRNDSRPQQIFACVSALSLSAPGHSANRALLISQPLFWYQFSAFIPFSTPAVFCRALPHNLGASRHRTLPQLNLHRARVRRNHGRLPSNGFIERAPERRARAHFFPESAPPIKR